MVGQYVECISIDHQRTLCTTQLGNHSDGRLLTGSQSGTNAYSVEILGINSLGEYGLLTIELNDGLRHADLQEHTVLPGGMGDTLTHPYPETGLRGQHGGTSHTIAASDDQGVAHLPLMGKGVARQ